MTEHALTVRARHSSSLNDWMVQIRKGSTGPQLTFRASEARDVSDALIDLIEALESKNGDV